MDDRDRMDRRPMWVPWAVTAFALFLVAFGAFAFGTRFVVNADGENLVHTWHFGFPGFFFAWFLLFFIFGGLRRMFWWGGYYPYHRPWRYRRYWRYGDPYEDEREWEEWHRREHQRMDERGRTGSTDGGNGGRAS